MSSTVGQPPISPPDVAIVGLGAAARAIWVPALSQIGATIVAGADPDGTARRSFGRLVPRASLHPDLETLLGDHAAPWIVVAAPPGAHGALVSQALDAGRHVLCEKPFVADLPTADRLIAQAASAGLALAVNHELPRLPILAATLSRLLLQTDGRLRFAEIQQRVDDRAVQGWRAEGATMREFGTHAVDLLLRAFGGSPRFVTARMPRPVPGHSGDPIDLVTFEWSDGRAAQLTLCRLSPGQHRYFEARFDCEHSALRCSIGGRAGLRLGIDPRRRRPTLRVELAGGGQAWSEQGSRRRVYATDPRDGLISATAALTRDTFAEVAQGRSPPCDGAVARAVLEVVDAAYRSASDGRTVSLP